MSQRRYHNREHAGKRNHIHIVTIKVTHRGTPLEYQNKNITIVMADDDEDDCILVRDAFMENRIPVDLRFVEDGEELMEFLQHQGKYGGADAPPRPDIILLDLNMPRKNGREVLREIKADPHLRGIPVVVLTTSREYENIMLSYDLGASSFITKPATFTELVEMARILSSYWLGIVTLPGNK